MKEIKHFLFILVPLTGLCPVTILLGALYYPTSTGLVLLQHTQLCTEGT